MATNVTWNGTTYSIPAAGEVGWSALSNFLIALGNGAAVAEEMKQTIRVATTSPVTVSDTTDCVVVTDLGTPGAVAVNLPSGTAGRFFFIIDGKGDAATNNITITPSGGQTIGGAASLVLTNNRDAVVLVYSATGTDWKVIGPVTREADMSLNDIGGTLSVAKGGTGITSGTSGGVPYYSGSSNIASSGALTSNGVMLGGGAGSSPTSTSAGSANQVFRVPGAGGAPAFGAVDLTQAAAVTGALPIGNGGTGQATANAALNALLPSQGGNGGKVLSTDGSNTSWQTVATADNIAPVGSIVSYNPGYYTNGSNGGFTLVGPATNNAAGVNAYIPTNWRVCDGAALNDAASPIWNAAGRFLPNLTDSRFFMGSTAAGTVGGSNTMAHTHSVTSNVTVAAHGITQPTFDVPSHYHGKGTLAITGSGSSNHAHPIQNLNTARPILAAAAGAGTSYDRINAGVTLNQNSSGTEVVWSIPSNSGTHTHSNSDFSGSVGNTGGSNGDGTFSASRTTDVSLTNNHSVTNNSVTSGAASNDENRPLYLSTFYIVRVK